MRGWLTRRCLVAAIAAAQARYSDNGSSGTSLAELDMLTASLAHLGQAQVGVGESFESEGTQAMNEGIGQPLWQPPDGNYMEGNHASIASPSLMEEGTVLAEVADSDHGVSEALKEAAELSEDSPRASPESAEQLDQSTMRPVQLLEQSTVMENDIATMSSKSREQHNRNTAGSFVDGEDDDGVGSDFVYSDWLPEGFDDSAAYRRLSVTSLSGIIREAHIDERANPEGAGDMPVSSRADAVLHVAGSIPHKNDELEGVAVLDEEGGDAGDGALVIKSLPVLPTAPDGQQVGIATRVILVPAESCARFSFLGITQSCAFGAKLRAVIAACAMFAMYA